jgi:hypothetical protein
LQKTADYYNKNLYLCKTVQNGQETTNLLHIELQQKSSTIFTKNHKRLQHKKSLGY